MKTRILSAAVLLPLLFVVVLLLPAWGTAVLFGLASALAAYELLYRTGYVKHPRLVAYAMIMAMLVSLWSLNKSTNLAGLGFMAYLVLLFAELMISGGKLPFEKVCLCLGAGVLFPYLLSAFVRIRAMFDGIDPGDTTFGKFMIFVPCILAFTADSAAYFVGRKLGKHKLAPVISPKKTVEGAIGGVVATVLLMELYALVLDKAFGFDVIYWYGIVYGVLGSLVSILGDLTFSVIKRQVNMKDYGNLIPGHGGVLDRFDSMMLVAPVSELLILMLPLAVATAGVG